MSRRALDHAHRGPLVAGGFHARLDRPGSRTRTRRTAGIVFGRAHGGYTPEATGRRTITILAIGSDARPGENPLRSRADSIHVIFLHPRKGKAVIVGIPRDSWVSIPGLGTTKINAAMASGGPERMVRNGRAQLRRTDRLLGRHDVHGHREHGRPGRRAAGPDPVPHARPVLGLELRARPSPPPRQGRARVRARSAQRAGRRLRATGERRTRLPLRPDPVPAGIPGGSGPPAHVDRGRRSEPRHRPPDGRARGPRVHRQPDRIEGRPQRRSARRYRHRSGGCRS